MIEQFGTYPALALVEARRRALAVDGWGAVWVFPCDRCGYLLGSCRCRGEDAIDSVPVGLVERRARAAVNTQMPDADENRRAA